MSLKINNSNIDNITINVIEYFKNDSIVIKDFLFLESSPWDTLFMIKYNLTMEELKNVKESVINNLIEKKIIKMIDKYDDLQENEYNDTKEEVKDLFYEDAECCNRIIEGYMFDISKKRSVNIDLFNFFKLDIEEILQDFVYNLEYYDLSQIEFDSDFLDNIKEKYKEFVKSVYENFADYIENFVSEELSNLFIGYIFSIIYAYAKIYIDSTDDTEIDESVFANLLDSTFNFKEFLLNSPEMIIKILDYLNDLYYTCPNSFDLRKTIDDEQSQDLFANVDPFYNSNFENSVLLNDITIEDKLEKIMRSFKNIDSIKNNGMDSFYSNDEIINYLDGIKSLYLPLLSVGLDARYEEYYSVLIIKKFVSDVYEYLGYIKNSNIQNTFDSEYIYLYNEISNLDYDWQNIYEFFYTNYSAIIDLWFRYSNKDINFHIKAALEAKNNGDYENIISINSYAVYRFSKLQNTKELKSVDCMNSIIKQMATGSYNFKESATDICNIICLNIYERLSSIDNLDEEQSEFLKLITETDDLPRYLELHKHEFWRLINIFDKINPTEVDYIKECNLRKKVTKNNNVKILKKLNPFNE